MKQLNGSNYEFDGRNYEFDFKNANGQNTHAVIISVGGKRFIQWGISGAETAGNEIGQLIDSMKHKKQRRQNSSGLLGEEK